MITRRHPPLSSRGSAVLLIALMRDAGAGYDDSGWRTQDVPHDWSIELDPTAGPGTSAGTGFLEGGLGFYRKTFTLSPSQAGGRISIELDGVYMNSEV